MCVWQTWMKTALWLVCRSILQDGYSSSHSDAQLLFMTAERLAKCANVTFSGSDCRISIAVTGRKLLLSPKPLTSTFNKKWTVNCLIYLIVIQVMHWTCEDFTYCINRYQHVTLSGKKTNPFTLFFFLVCQCCRWTAWLQSGVGVLLSAQKGAGTTASHALERSWF